MKLDINKNYSIESNPLEFMVIEKSVVQDEDSPNKGNPTEKVIAHCTKLQSVFDFLIDRTIKTSTAINDMKQVLNEVRQIKRDIDRALKDLR